METVLLLREVIAIQYLSKLAKRIVEVVCGTLLSNFLVQDIDGLLRSALLVGCQGRGRCWRLS